MAGLTTNVVLRPARADGLYPVHLVFIQNRVPKYLSLGIAVPKKDWNEKASLQLPKWVKASNLAAAPYNETIRRHLALAWQWVEADPNLTADRLREVVKANQTPEQAARAAQLARAQEDFLEFFAEEVARRRASGKLRTAERLHNILRKLREYQGWVPATATTPEVPPRPLLYPQLTPQYIADYRQWVTEVKGNSGQTPDKELSFIKTVLRIAIDEGKMIGLPNPFARIKFKTPKATKTKLTQEEVARVESVLLPGNPGLRISREVWMLQYYLYGSRVADVLLLRWRNVDEHSISFQEQKTGKFKSVGLHQRLHQLLERLRRVAADKGRPLGPNEFLVPLLEAKQWYTQDPPEWSMTDLEASAQFRKHYEALLARLESCTAKINYYLKTVALLAGVDKHLTSHVARHSFTWMARQSGVNSFDLRDMLLHHSVTMTEIYAGTLEESELAKRAHELYQRPGKDAPPV